MFKFVSTMHGGQFVALTGTLKMAMLCVDNWDIYHKVLLVSMQQLKGLCDFNLGNWKTLKAGTGSGNGTGNVLSGFKMRMRMTLMNGRGSLLMEYAQSNLCGFMHIVFNE